MKRARQEKEETKVVKKVTREGKDISNLNLYTMKLEKKKVFAFRLKERKAPIIGGVVDFGKEWYLIKLIPVDYVIDGLCLIRRKCVKSFERTREEKFTETVLKAKKVNYSNKFKFSIDTELQIFNALLSKKLLFQFELNNEDITYVGKISAISDSALTLDCLTSKGEWLGQNEYKKSSIRVIQLDNDYLQSLSAFLKLSGSR